MGGNDNDSGLRGTGVFIPPQSVLESIHQRSVVASEGDSRRHSINLDTRPDSARPLRQEPRRFSLDTLPRAHRSGLPLAQGVPGAAARNGCSARLLAAYHSATQAPPSRSSAGADAAGSMCALGSSFFASASTGSSVQPAGQRFAGNVAAAPAAAPVARAAPTTTSISALPVPASSTFRAPAGPPSQQQPIISHAAALPCAAGFTQPRSSFQQQQQQLPQPSWTGVPAAMSAGGIPASCGMPASCGIPASCGMPASCGFPASCLQPRPRAEERRLMMQLQQQQQQSSQAASGSNSAPLPKLGPQFADPQLMMLAGTDATTAGAGFDQEQLLTEQLARLLDEAGDSPGMYSQPCHSPACSACQMPMMDEGGRMLMCACDSQLAVSGISIDLPFRASPEPCLQFAVQHSSQQQQRHELCMAAVAASLAGGAMNATLSIAAQEKLQQLLAVQELQLEIQSELLQLLPCT